MASEQPLVSALITVRDGESYLAEAIESVLSQTHPRIEAIVVDNGSTDSSGEIARSYERVRVCEEPTPGIPAARNAGLDEAGGEFFAFLDCDDVWEPAKTELQLRALAAQPGVDIVLGNIQQFASSDLDPRLTAGLRIPSEPQPGLHLGAVLARREVWDRVGPWPPEIEISDGLHWFLRARSLGLRELMIPEVVMRRRVHGANHSYLNRESRPEFARVLKGSMDRRRRGGARSSS